VRHEPAVRQRLEAYLSAEPLAQEHARLQRRARIAGRSSDARETRDPNALVEVRQEGSRRGGGGEAEAARSAEISALTLECRLGFHIAS